MTLSRPGSSSTPQNSLSSSHQPMRFVEFVALVASLIALNAVALDMMMPALPDIGAALGVQRDNDRQAILTSFILGFAVGQLAVGPLSDRYGRRPVLLAGLLVYVAASLLCAAAPTFDTLLLARVVCGMGAASSRVVIVAVVRDCYAGQRMASVMSFAMMVFIAVPVLAPSIGQVVVLLWPWQSIFLLLAAAGLITSVWTAMRLPETLRAENQRTIRPRDLAQALGSLATNRQTMGYTLAGGIMQGGLYAFLLSAQQVLGEYYQLGVYFPLAFAASAVTIALSSFLNARLVGQLGMRLISHSASVAFLTLGVVMMAMVMLDILTFWPFMVLLSAITFLIGLTFGNYNALAMEPQGRIAGTASSFLGSLTTFIAVAIGGGVAYAYDGTLWPLAIGYLCVGIVVLMVLLVTEKGRLFGPHTSQPPAPR